MSEELDEADRARLERLHQQTTRDLEYANRAGFGDPMKERMAGTLDRVAGKLGYEPGLVEES